MSGVIPSLVTGSPIGSVLGQEVNYLEGSPYIYFQDANASPLNNPDVNGFYWGLSGTATYPVYNLGCVQNVKLTEKVTMNDVRCDTVGVVDTIQKRDYVEFDMTVLSQLPISVLRHLMNLGSAPTVSGHVEMQGIGMIQNTQKYHVYAPKIYDDVNGYYLFFYLHQCKFVDAWTLDMKYGASWELQKIVLRAYNVISMPTSMRFGTIFREDASQI